VTWTEVLFIVFGLVAVGSALASVTSRQVFHAVLWIVVTLLAVAGCFVLMTAEFVAWVQVLVYAGSVAVLAVFALMLTRRPTDVGSAEVTGNQPLAAVLGVATSAGLGATMVAGFSGERIAGRAIGSAEAVGEALFNHWVLGFEILSGVLLAALVGAIVISRSGESR
jgi:NADH-quinone oxidoreductase subunit J